MAQSPIGMWLTSATAPTEVRSLAERVQIAAKEISELSARAASQANSAGAILAEMVPVISRTSSLVAQIAVTSERQSAGLEEISQAMAQVSQATERNAHASEQLASTAEGMSAQANSLQRTVSQFQLSYGGMRRGKETSTSGATAEA